MAFRCFSRLETETLFESEHLSKDLGRKSVRGGVITMSAQGVSFAINLGRMMILARLLAPADFGIIGMVMVVVGFANMFKDAGLSMATVQKDKINEGQISTLFWCNVVLSVFLGLCVLLSSPLVALFYEKPELTAVTAALSISFLFSGSMIQHQALMRRHMAFKQLAYIQVVTQIFSLVVAAALAGLGWRYWALVGSTIALAVANMTMVFLYCSWIPKRPAKGTGIRDMLKFGGHLTAFNFLNYFIRIFDQAVVGKLAGATELGYYNKAYGLLMMPLNNIKMPITSVLVPAMSRTSIKKPKYAEYYEKANSLVSLMTMAGVIFLIWNAQKFILFFLGEKWLPAVPIFQGFCIGGVIQPLAGLTGCIAVSAGKPDKLLKWRIASFWIYPLCFVAGYWFLGITGAAIGRSIGLWIAFFPCLYYIAKGTSINFIKLCVLIARNLFLATAVNMIAYYTFLGNNILIAATTVLMLTIILNEILPMKKTGIELVWKIIKK